MTFDTNTIGKNLLEGKETSGSILYFTKKKRTKYGTVIDGLIVYKGLTEDQMLKLIKRGDAE